MSNQSIPPEHPVGHAPSAAEKLPAMPDPTRDAGRPLSDAYTMGGALLIEGALVLFKRAHQLGAEEYQKFRRGSFIEDLFYQAVSDLVPTQTDVLALEHVLQLALSVVTERRGFYAALVEVGVDPMRFVTDPEYATWADDIVNKLTAEYVARAAKGGTGDGPGTT